MNLRTIEKNHTNNKKGLYKISAHMGKLPSVFFPNSIGRLIWGCEANETNKEINEAYKNGIDNNLNPMLLKYINNMKWKADFKNMNLEIPQLNFDIFPTWNLG